MAWRHRFLMLMWEWEMPLRATFTWYNTGILYIEEE